MPSERVVLTVGGLQGFVFYAAEQLARDPGRVLVEAPSYDRPLKVLAREAAPRSWPLPMDDEGLDPDALAAELAGRSDPPSFLYTIPTFQNPSGRTLSAERRTRLVEVAREHDLAVLEDDPYGLVRFDGAAPRSLLELEGGTLVTYTSSFSKTVAPGVRTGYFVLPNADAAGFEERAVSTYISPPFLPEAIVWEFVRRGRFEPNLERVCAELRARRDAMLEALAASLLARRELEHARRRLLRVARPRRHRHRASSRLAPRRPVSAIVPGASFFPRDSGLGGNSARLAYSYETPDESPRGSNCWRPYAERRRPRIWSNR